MKLGWMCLVAGGLLAGCGPGLPLTKDATWDEDATAYRGLDGERVTYNCPAGGTEYSVWGTGTYTDDSSVCTAAVHAGKISLAAGGSVVFEVAPGLAGYTGSTANGITSADWNAWDGSFTFP